MCEGSGMGRWGADFDPDRLADLETGMWKAYYRRQPARLFGLLIQGLREQGHASWPRAIAAGFFLTKGAAGFARATGDYDRFAPDIARGSRRAVDDRQVAAQCPGQPAPRVGPEVGVVIDTGCDLRMRDLEQERPWTGPEQEHRLAVEGPRL